MNMERVYNFSAGPAMLPAEVVERASEGLQNFMGLGMSVMEIGRNTPEYEKLVETVRDKMRKILNIPDNYKILFLPGTAEAQFAAIPLNILSFHKCADYVLTGQASKKAELEAKKYGDIVIAASSSGANPTYSTIPETKRSSFRSDADYVHITYNDTIYGTKYPAVPDTSNITLVADMSSFLLTEPIPELAKFGMIYASSECNIGPAGMTVIIIRSDLVGDVVGETPSHLNYKLLSESSVADIAVPAWCLYVSELVFDWIESVGGLEEIKRRNERKASLLYDYLDSQSYYTAPVNKKCRSMVNVVFVTGDAKLDSKFIKEAEAEGLINLYGHNSVGGIRASIYNAMPYEGVEKLVAFMKRFAQENPKLDS